MFQTYSPVVWGSQRKEAGDIRVELDRNLSLILPSLCSVSTPCTFPLHHISTPMHLPTSRPIPGCCRITCDLSSLNECCWLHGHSSPPHPISNDFNFALHSDSYTLGEAATVLKSWQQSSSRVLIGPKWYNQVNLRTTAGESGTVGFSLYFSGHHDV